MRKQNWPKRDPIKTISRCPMRSTIWDCPGRDLGVQLPVAPGEDRRTYQCLLSYREIGDGVGTRRDHSEKVCGGAGGAIADPHGAHLCHYQGRP